MKNKKAILIIALIAVVLGTGTYIFFRPVPVLDAGKINDYDARINVYYAEENYSDSNRAYFVSVVSDNAVAKAVLNYLSTCKIRRTLFPRTDYQYLEFFIGITDNTNPRNNIDFNIQKDGGNELWGSSGFPYRILNSKEVIKDLEEIIMDNSAK